MRIELYGGWASLLIPVALVSCGHKQSPPVTSDLASPLSTAEDAQARDFAAAPQLIVARVSRDGDLKTAEVRGVNEPDLNSPNAAANAFASEGTPLHMGQWTSELDQASSTNSYWYDPSQQGPPNGQNGFISNDNYFGPNMNPNYGVGSNMSPNYGSPDPTQTGYGSMPSYGSMPNGNFGYGTYGAMPPNGSGPYGNPGIQGAGYPQGYLNNRPVWQSNANWGSNYSNVYYGYSAPTVYQSGNSNYCVYRRPTCHFRFCRHSRYAGYFR